MKAVFDHIARRSAEYAEEPLFVRLRDPSVDTEEKLNFAPWAAHFVMTFADLYHFFLPTEKPRDRFEELTNVHLSEEGTHWKWYLADLSIAEMDPMMRFTDALRFIWSDATIKTRKLAYEMCRLSAGLDSLQKLVMVNAIEATGRVALEAVIPVGMEVAARTGRRLTYFGNHHLETERHHTLEDESVRRSLEEMTLDPAMRENLFSIVDRVFEHFRGLSDDSFRIARTRRGITDDLRALESQALASAGRV